MPDTGINRFVELLGSDTGSFKWLMIFASIACNVIFSDEFVSAFLDRSKSSWEVAGLQLLYFVIENIDNYAALCLGNISQDLVEYNPFLAYLVGLMFGQLYGSDLWVAGKNIFWIVVVICRCIRDTTEKCISSCAKQEEESNKGKDDTSCCLIITSIFVYMFAIGTCLLVILLALVLLVGQIVPPIIDSFALPFLFFQSMLGASADVRQFEKFEANGDEWENATEQAACTNFCDPCEFWRDSTPRKIVHRFLQLMFTLGLLFFTYAKRLTDGTEGTPLATFEELVFYVMCGAMIVHVLEFLGARKLVVRMRSQIPDMQRNVNQSYLENRANNRYGLIPYLGPVFSGLCAFLNQPPLKERDKKCKFPPYLANFITYGVFFGAVYAYEKGQNAVAIVLAIITFILSIYDTYNDVCEAMNFKVEKFEHICKKK